MEFVNYEDFINFCVNNNLRNSKEKIPLVVQALTKLVSSTSSRIEYSPFSRFVFNNNDEDVEILQNNITTILHSDYIGKHGDLKKAILKMYDHVNLAVSQKQLVYKVVLVEAISQINVLNDQVKELEEKASLAIANLENFKESFDEVDKDMKILKDSLVLTKQQNEELKNKLNEAEEATVNINKTFEQLKLDKTKIYTDFVTILGIFATIIFAAFGGLNLLNGIFSNLEDVRVGKLLIFSSLIIGAIISMLFILLNGIAKLTGLNLRSCKCHEEKKECKHTLIQKHPSIFIISLLIFFIFLEGVALYFVKYKAIIEWVNNLSLMFQTILLGMPLLLVYLVWKYVIVKSLRNL